MDSEELDDDAPVTRGTARLNRSVAAMMRRGINNHLAAQLHQVGQTLANLKQLSDADLSRLGLSEADRLAVRRGPRADIPFANLARVLWANRSTCCVCRRPSLAIIVHHIEPWASSHDHRDENLAVVCLEHHARAHTRGALEQNLTPRRLKDSKKQWEEEVGRLDPRAILEASRIDGHHWWWFNHVRLLEMATRLKVPLTKNPFFPRVYRRDLVDEEGLLRGGGEGRSYLYQGGDGNYLYYYMTNVLMSVLEQTAVFNISDDLDRGFLARVVSPGDIVLVQGRHVFKRLNKLDRGPGQAAEVRRQANGVRVSFTVDLWEAVATSAWANWMRGVQRAASIVRIVDIEREDGQLLLKCTGLAIGFPLNGLSTRSYLYASWPDQEEIDEDDWLADFENADI